eukprot:15435633-Alexandrium_andersonii.AAC.1
MCCGALWKHGVLRSSSELSRALQSFPEASGSPAGSLETLLSPSGALPSASELPGTQCARLAWLPSITNWLQLSPHPLCDHCESLMVGRALRVGDQPPPTRAVQSGQRNLPGVLGLLF